MGYYVPFVRCIGARLVLLFSMRLHGQHLMSGRLGQLHGRCGQIIAIGHIFWWCVGSVGVPIKVISGPFAFRIICYGIGAVNGVLGLPTRKVVRALVCSNCNVLKQRFYQVFNGDCQCSRVKVHYPDESCTKHPLNAQVAASLTRSAIAMLAFASSRSHMFVPRGYSKEKASIKHFYLRRRCKNGRTRSIG